MKVGNYKWTPVKIILLIFLLSSMAAVAVIWYKDKADTEKRKHDREISALQDELNAVVNAP